MKTLPISISAAMVAFFLVSCERDKGDLDAKLEKLEKEAAAATEKQRALEEELAQQKLAAEISEIERERTRLEEERLAMESELRDKDEKLAAEFEQRQRDLEERERKLAEQAEEQDKRQQELTGLEEKLDEKERDVAGRAPINSMPEGRDVNFGSATGDYSTFYDSLSDYGSWFQTSDYGYVYQPTVVRDSSWRPYTRGRWALTNHGWTWVSSEPFGWACYHYGRWALLRGVGWVWVPGTEWAPAWVTWRESPGHVGWAPLPPETLGWRNRAWDSSVEVTFGIGSGWFTFVSYKNFGGNIQPYCLPVVQNTTIFRQTKNITIYQIRDSRIYVGGPSYRNVCDRIGRQFPIHHLSVRNDFPSRKGEGQWSSRFRGRELEVIAPRIGADWNAALSPVRVRRDLGRIEVERTRDLPVDVRDHFRKSRTTDRQRADKVIAEAGGREQLDRYRRNELERNREIERSAGVVREKEKPLPEKAIPVVPEPPTRIRDRGPQNMGGDEKVDIVVPPAPEFPGAEPKPGTIVPKPTGLEGDEQKPTETVLPKPEIPGQDEDGGNRLRDREQGERNRREKEELQKQQEEAAKAEEKAKQEQENVMRERAEQMRREREERDAGENDKEREQRNEEFQESERKQKEEEAMRREQEEQAQRAKEEANRVREEAERMKREKVEEERGKLEEAQREKQEMRKQQEEALRQQKEAEKQRKAEEDAQQKQLKELKKQQEEEQRKAQEEATRRQREEMQRQKQEEALRQKEEMRQKQEEQSRRMREELERRQQEEQAKRQQQEELKRQQEEARRQQQEESRRQQEESRRQQEELRRQQQEAARQQQEEKKRQAEERVRRQREGN